MVGETGAERTYPSGSNTELTYAARLSGSRVCALHQGAGNFVKTQIVNILGFVVWIVSVAPI